MLYSCNHMATVGVKGLISVECHTRCKRLGDYCSQFLLRRRATKDCSKPHHPLAEKLLPVEFFVS